MSSETTITILPTHLRLVHIPLARKEALMSRILDCAWFRRENDPFFALCHNNVELSLFADAAAVRRCFGEYMTSPPKHERGKSPAGLKGKERAQEGEDVLVGEDLWVALEITFGGNGWEEAAPRLHALTSPLAASNISILFVSSFSSDHILVRASSLGHVTSILEDEGFSFAEADKTMEAELKGMRTRQGQERAAGEGSGRSTRRSSRADGTMCDDDEDGLSDLVGSLVLSDAGSAGTAGGGGRGASSNERPSASRSSSFSLSRSNSLHLTSSAASAPPSPNPMASTSIAAPLALLPDELVCIGLSPAHEAQWRIKVVEALFYPERVLPPPSSPISPTSATPRSFSPYPTSIPLPLSRQASLNRHRQHSHPRVSTDIDADEPRPPASSRPVPPSRSESTSLPTTLAPYPVPFVALTQTPDGTSLTADVRLLRRLFPRGGDGDGGGDEMVFATGEAGLAGAWEGEEGLRGWEAELEALQRDAGALEGDEAVSSSEDEGDACGTDTSGDDGYDWEAVSPSVESSVLPSTDEDEEDDGEDFAATSGPSDRTLLKCLQLDLTSLGLDKPGLVEEYANLLINGGVRSLMYQSTFGSANILVAKRDVGRARRLLLRG